MFTQTYFTTRNTLKVTYMKPHWRWAS